MNILIKNSDGFKCSWFGYQSAEKDKYSLTASAIITRNTVNGYDFMKRWWI